MRTLFTRLTLLLMFTLTSLTTLAQVAPAPPLISFSGRLARPDGVPVTDGSYTLRFSLWDSASGGTEKWNQTLSSVTVKNGSFAVLLNTDTAGLFHNNLWLEIKIGADAPLTPRQQVVSVAYALKANSVADNSITSASIVNGAITGADIANATITANKLSGGGAPPTGPAGGDLTGSYPNPGLATQVSSLPKVSGNLMNYGSLGNAGVDQQQNSSLFLATRFSGWQSFTPSISGELTRLDIRQESTDNNPINTILRIYAGEGTGGTLLRQQDVTLHGTSSDHTFTFSPPISLTQGQKYTWQIGPENTGGRLGFYYHSSNPYPHGRNDGGDAEDYVFTTYMRPQALTVHTRQNVIAGLNLDTANLFDGVLNSTRGNVLRFGDIGSGEAIGSKRTSGGNQYGLDFFTSYQNRMSITNEGNVGIGTTNPSVKLQVNGSVAGVGNYINLSDARYKTHVQTIPDALAAIFDLRGVTFDWKQADYPGMNFSAGRQIGFLAQEVEKVLPELVVTDSQGYKSVAYANVVPVLVEAVKQQQQQIEALRLHLKQYENRQIRMEEVLRRFDTLRNQR